jgi:hypothetical protein
MFRSPPETDKNFECVRPLSCKIIWQIGFICDTFFNSDLRTFFGTDDGKRWLDIGELCEGERGTWMSDINDRIKLWFLWDDAIIVGRSKGDTTMDEDR